MSESHSSQVIKARKSLLFIAPQPFFQWRGTPIRVKFDVQALTELGFHVDLLTLPFGRDLDIPGGRIIRVPNPLHLDNLPIGPSLFKVAFDLVLLLKALSLMSHIRYDFVHCVEDAGVIGAILSSIHSCRFVYEKHSDPASYRRGWLRNMFLNLYRILEAYATRKADAVITGPSLFQQARAAAPHQRIHSIASLPSSLEGANDKRVRAIRKELTREKGEILITYVGSFALYQGIDLMFGSVSRVLQDNPLSRFIIIGGTAKEIAQWNRWLIARSVADSVTFLGKVNPDQLPHYLAASHILLSPRIAGQNSPIKLLDYLKAGRPIVATDIHANRVLLDESVSLFTQPTPRSFAAGISRLARDPDLRQRLSRSGSEMAKERHTYAVFKRGLDICYSELSEAWYYSRV